MKRFLTYLFFASVMLCAFTTAQAQTSKAIVCLDDKTLFFVYDSNTYAAGDTYTADDQTTHTITEVYSEDLTSTLFVDTRGGKYWGANGTDVNMSSYQIHTSAPWYYYMLHIETVDFQASFIDLQPTSMASWFSYMTALKEVKNTNNLYTASVTSWEKTFLNCENLESLDVSDWNTSNVTDMRQMFSGCITLESLDVSDWNTSNVTDMSIMFQNCISLTSLDVSNWNTSNVTNMRYMFFGYDYINEELTQYPSLLESLDVSNWDTSNVTNMEGMFGGCLNLTSLDVSRWNTSKVTNMGSIFELCPQLTSLDVSGWDTSNVTEMEALFYKCSSLTSIDVSGWDTSKVTDIASMFNGCSSLTSIDVSNFDTSNVTGWLGLNYMFYNCSNLTSLTFSSGFSMDKVTSSVNMFQDASKLRFIDFHASNDVDAITTVDRSSGMFNGVPATTVIYLPEGAVAPSGDLQNVVYTSGSELHCDDYYSEDKVDIELPRDFLAARAQYSRTMSTQFGTCVLPYEFNSNSDIQAYILTQEHPETMYFEEAATVPAHTPFLFQKLGSAEFIEGETGGAYSITVKATRDTKVGGPYEGSYTDVTAQKTASATPEAQNLTWNTRGYYVNQTIDANNSTFYIAQDKFWKATTETTLPPHRATFVGTWYYTQNQGAPSFSIVLAKRNGETTSLSALDIDRDDAASEYFDASGRRQNELRPGLNIVRKADGKVVKVVK